MIFEHFAWDLIDEIHSRGSIDLTDRWARTLMTSINWSYRKQITSKLTVAPALKCETRWAFKKKIANAIVQHKIIEDLVINFDHSPLSPLEVIRWRLKGIKKVVTRKLP